MESTKKTQDEHFLWYLGDPSKPRLVGTIKFKPVSKGVSLTYAPSWIEKGFALSADLPLRAVEHLPQTKATAAGAVDDARPDRWGELVIRRVERPKRLSVLEFLYYAGDDRFGALGVSSSMEAYKPHRRGPLPRLDEAADLAEAVANIAADRPLSDSDRRLGAGGSNFGGAKPKAILEMADSEWLVKFFNNEPNDVPLIEHAAMTLAAKAGITVSQTKVIELPGENILAVRRFDRVGNRRVHCISAGTALRAAAGGEDPDFSYPALAQLLRQHGDTKNDTNLQEMRELFRRMVFNILIDNTDDHEKNHTIMVIDPETKPKYRLAPAYDVLPVNSGQGFQEFRVGLEGQESTLANAMSECEQFAMTPQEAAAEVAQVIKVVGTWREHFKACGVSDSDLADLAERIDGDELLGQRESFDPKAYGAKKATTRTSPFSPA